MKNTEEKERIVHNIEVLQDKLSLFLYTTDYFGLSDEIESNKPIMDIIKLVHKLYDKINECDYLD